MAYAVGIKFDPDSFPVYFKPLAEPLDENDFCVVRDPEKGAELIGYVACFEGRCECHTRHLPPIVRRATDEEVDQWHRRSRRHKEALATARVKVVEHGLPMKLINVRFNEEQNVVLFYFTADHRIDFRELVRDLAGVFKARIELWQIGSRQGAAEKNGFGHCGRHLCCASWMKAFPPISIRQARDQDINQSPPKLSGLCGRLRCCLKFEHEAYCELRKGAPALNGKVRDESGREGHLVDRNLLTGMALVHFEKSKLEWLEFAKLKALGHNGKEQPQHAAVAAEPEEDEAVVDYEENA